MWRGGGAGPLESSTAFAIVPPAFCPSYSGPQANRRDTGKLDVVPVWGLRRRPFARSVPVAGLFLKTGPAGLGLFFSECRTKGRPFWGVPRQPRKRGLCIVTGFTRPPVSVASLLLENHRFAWGDGVCFESWPRLWKRYGRESEKGVAHETYSDVGPVGPEPAVRHGVRQNGRRHDDLV